MDTLLSIVAEGEGFKPPIPEKGIPDFESSAIDHSANLPHASAAVCCIVQATKPHRYISDSQKRMQR